MAAVAVLLAVLVFLWPGNAADAAQSTPTDCSIVIQNLTDCATFTSDDSSTVKKPTRQCCSALETVLKTNARCLCDVSEHEKELDVDINFSKASTLSAACRFPSPPASFCGLTQETPSSPPVNAAATLPSTDSVLPADTMPTPIAAPVKAGASSTSFTISVGSVLITTLAGVAIIMQYYRPLV